MFTHVVMMTLKADAPSGRAEEIVAALRQLPAVVPSLKEYRVGTDLGLNDGNYDVALVGTFEDEAGYRAYSTHPAHLKIIDELVRDVTEHRAAVQFES